jgi:ribosomal protein L37E
MASCEKCWGDAYMRIHTNPMKSQAEHYQDLIKERTGEKACTPEQQAGQDATVCKKCGRKTVHQYVKVCMNCGVEVNEA